MSLLQAYLSLYISPWWPGEVNYLRKGGVGITRTKRQWQGCSVLDCDVKNGQTRCEYCHSCMCPPQMQTLRHAGDRPFCVGRALRHHTRPDHGLLSLHPDSLWVALYVSCYGQHMEGRLNQFSQKIQRHSRVQVWRTCWCG